MNTKQARLLIKAFLDNRLTKEAQQRFSRWLTDHREKEEKEAALLQLWDEVDTRPDDGTMADLYRVHRKIEERSEKRRLHLSTFARIAAVALLLLGSSFFTFYLTQRYATGDIELVESFAPNGETRLVTLPDSSKVWLNAGSMLVYPERFARNERKVFLTGEANFDVAKHRGKRFIVTTHNLTVEALGTVFNVQDYPELNRATATLEEGVVKVETKSGTSHSAILKPNEQIVYNSKTDAFALHMVDAARIAMWKEGYMVFQEASFDEILNALGRRYDVTVHFDAGKYEGRTFTVRFFPDETLPETLEIMREIIDGFRYTIKENRLYIY